MILADRSGVSSRLSPGGTQPRFRIVEGHGHGPKTGQKCKKIFCFQFFQWPAVFSKARYFFGPKTDIIPDMESMPYFPKSGHECNHRTWNPRHLTIFCHVCGHFRVFCGPLQKLLSRSGYEKRTEYVFYTRSKRMVRKSVVHFKPRILFIIMNTFFEGSSPPFNAENNHLNKMALGHLGQSWCGRMLFYGNS